MTVETRLPLEVAKMAADDLIEQLRDVCERIEIAGSIRRGAETCKDVELVIIPKLERRAVDLFGDVTEMVSLLDDRLAQLERQGAIGRRRTRKGSTTWGPRTKYATYYGVPVDIFAVLPPAQWGPIMTIRTGPWEFSKALVTARSAGGLRPDHLQFREGQIWAGPLPLNCPEESDVFATVGIPYTEPHLRGQRLTRSQETTL